MNCPRCRSKTRITNARTFSDGVRFRRRRECCECKFRFMTLESIARTAKQTEISDPVFAILLDEIQKLRKKLSDIGRKVVSVDKNTQDLVSTPLEKKSCDNCIWSIKGSPVDSPNCMECDDSFNNHGGAH